MYQVAIVGAGIIGAAIAYELSLIDDLEITLLDAARPGQGATGAALGLLMAVISQKKQGRGWQLRQQGLERYRQVIPELEKIIGYSLPVNRRGLLKLLMEDNLERWQKLQHTRQSQGYPLEIWNAKQLHSRLPWLPTHLSAAVYSPADWQIQPRPLTQALIQAAKKKGVRCQFDCLVYPLTSGSRSVRQLETANGTLPVDFVIITAGLGSTPLTQHQEGSIALEAVIGQAWRLQFPPSLTDLVNQPVLTAKDIHLIPLPQNQAWLGATVEFPADCPHGQPSAALQQELWQGAIATYPILKHATILEHWSGRRPRPVGESAPVIRPLPGLDNVLLASGHYRNGILLAPGTMLAVRHWLLSYLST